jgi:predicted ABC-type ATPase
MSEPVGAEIPEGPTCWLIAGPNGAGKTTFALEFLRQVGCVHFVNADLIYLALPEKAMSHQRVAERVAHGGHDIPAADIERRFARSLRNLFDVFAGRVDACSCLLNSGPVPELVFEESSAGRVVIDRLQYDHLQFQARQT